MPQSLAAGVKQGTSTRVHLLPREDLETEDATSRPVVKVYSFCFLYGSLPHTVPAQWFDGEDGLTIRTICPRPTSTVMQVRKLHSSYKTIKVNLLRLKDRQTLYETKLIPQINEQTEASLTAYTNDDGSFAEVVRSRISLLGAQIDILNINVNIQKNIVKYNYLFASDAKEIIKIVNR